jgi:hypothetical protein
VYSIMAMHPAGMGRYDAPAMYILLSSAWPTVSKQSVSSFRRPPYCSIKPNYLLTGQIG